MQPIGFLEQNCTYGKDQADYLPLPAYKSKDGELVCCWALSWRERIKVFITGRLWHSVLTFNKPLQPQYLSVDAILENQKGVKS